MILFFVQIVALALWCRDQHANVPTALQNRDDSHENRDHPKFVAPKLVRGTLIEGARRLHDVEPGLPRALYAMFLVAEVHPFNDGNGRLARLVMNAELSQAHQCRIIVPTLYRESYLDCLRVLTREGDARAFIKAMTDIQRWTASFDYNSLDGVISLMNRCNAFEKSLVEFKLLNPGELPTQGPSVRATARPAFGSGT